MSQDRVPFQDLSLSQLPRIIETILSFHSLSSFSQNNLLHIFIAESQLLSSNSKQIGSSLHIIPVQDSPCWMSQFDWQYCFPSIHHKERRLSSRVVDSRSICEKNSWQIRYPIPNTSIRHSRKSFYNRVVSPFHHSICLLMIRRDLNTLYTIFLYEYYNMLLIFRTSINYQATKAAMTADNIFPQELRNSLRCSV